MGLIVGVLMLAMILHPVSADAAFTPTQTISWTIPDTDHAQPDLIVRTDSNTLKLELDFVVNNTFPKNGTYIGYNSTFMFYELPFYSTNNSIVVPVSQVPFVQRHGVI
jgi:hypothetical protein